MKRNAVVLALLAMLGLLAVGCQRDIAPTSSGLTNVADEPMTRNLNDPLAAATVTSATLTLYVTSTAGNTVEVHRITSPWLENTVTWNNFAGAYDPTIVTTFVGAPPGLVTVDITSLVQGWMDGTYPNYGLYLKQAGTNTFYRSSEDGLQATRPKIEICVMGGGCTTVQRGLSGTIADAYISALEPDRNEGAGVFLATGYPEGAIERNKGSLIQFSLPEEPLLAAIGDRVWYDNNMNGIQDAGENGVEDVTVRLMNCLGQVLATTTTNINGLYLFSNLIPGDYNIEFVLPDGYVFTNRDQGVNDAVDSDADVVTGRAICTNLIGGETDLTWDAGIYRRPQTGCTRTIGYWKTHAGFGPQRDRVTPKLPIWLGTAGGAKSVQVTTALQAVQIFECSTTGGEDNGIAKLMRQLLGAKLNIASGASNGDVASVIAASDAFLAMYNWMDWGSLTAEQQEMVLDWHSALDDYNNGYTGPGHCE